MMRSLLIAIVILLATACSNDAGTPASAPSPTEDASLVPITMRRVYLAVALACSIKDTGADFVPLKVEGPARNVVTVTPVDGCREQAIFSSYVYDIPVPLTGAVRITPGNQPAAEIDATAFAGDGSVTVFYARKGAGTYAVSVLRPGKDDAVKNAP
jgi:hypothetical protein